MLGKGSSHIREGVLGGVMRSVSPAWSLFQVICIELGDGGGGHGEMQMIHYLVGIAGRASLLARGTGSDRNQR